MACGVVCGVLCDVHQIRDKTEFGRGLVFLRHILKGRAELRTILLPGTAPCAIRHDSDSCE